METSILFKSKTACYRNGDVAIECRHLEDFKEEFLKASYFCNKRAENNSLSVLWDRTSFLFA